jgi:hypothetical protein
MLIFGIFLQLLKYMSNMRKILGKKRSIFCFMLLILSGGIVQTRADMAGGVALSKATSQGAIYLPSDRDLSVAAGWMNVGNQNLTWPSNVHARESLPTNSKKIEVKQIPAIPGSATLFLYMASGLGVYQLGRSVKSLNFGGLPDWYQTAGPRQIGHAHAVALSFNLLVIPTILVSFDEPLPEPSLTRCVREESPRFCPQYFLSEKDVRGPPSLA